jgi:hypothetical protein
MCIYYVNRRFRGTYPLHLQDRNICERGNSVSRGLETEPPVENTQLYKSRGREREWAMWEINREERGRVCRDQVGRLGEQVAESGPEQVEESCRGWGKSQGYRPSIDPVASGLELPSMQ